MRDARRAEGGGGWGCTSGRPALSVPRCPGVPPAGRSRGPGWPPPRAGRACGAAPGCACHPGTSQGGVNPEVQPGGDVRFYEFWSFLANFCLPVVVLPFWVRFFPKKKTEGGAPRAAPGAALPEVRPHLGRPGVSPCPG